MKDIRVLTDSNEIMELAILQVQGDRSDQQDSFGYRLEEKEGLVCVCDGMGGHKGGNLASKLAVEQILQGYRPESDPDEMLEAATKAADLAVAGLKDEAGVPLKAGSTVVTVLVKDGCLRWNSVGDSRVYLLRGEEFVQITTDQNYQTVLDEQLSAGAITREVYDRESPRGAALISFLGMGNLPFIDRNATPLVLMGEDRIVLMSDGLYKTLPDSDIKILLQNFSNVGDALRALEMKATKNAARFHIHRDNMTAAVIKIK